MLYNHKTSLFCDAMLDQNSYRNYCCMAHKSACHFASGANDTVVNKGFRKEAASVGAFASGVPHI